MLFRNPPFDCLKCERLVCFRKENRQKFPTYHNAPVCSFGSVDAQVLIVGLAPGLNGANKTGRPFTNDYAGDILYPSLKKFGFAKGDYKKSADDGFELINVRITNAVRCVPPQNKVTGEEVKNCRTFLVNELADMKNLKIVLTLGQVAHNALLGALGLKLSACKFGHGHIHFIKDKNLILINSYHTSRYNINTGVLTLEMFEDVIKKTKELL